MRKYEVMFIVKPDLEEAEMKKTAEDLEKITQPSIDIYVKKTGLPEETIKEMMNKSEYITSREAYELGFSTTQTRKNETMQYVESDFMFNLVMQNKALQNELENKNKELKELYEAKQQSSNKELNNTITEDAWTSFFSAKK